MISQSDLFKLFRMISRRAISCDECALRFYVCSIFVDRVFVLFIFHHGVHWTYKCFAYVAPRGWIWVRRELRGFGDIRGSVGRYDPWGIKATGFAVTTKINHYAAVTVAHRQVPSHQWERFAKDYDMSSTMWKPQLGAPLQECVGKTVQILCEALDLLFGTADIHMQSDVWTPLMAHKR